MGWVTPKIARLLRRDSIHRLNYYLPHSILFLSPLDHYQSTYIHHTCLLPFYLTTSPSPTPPTSPGPHYLPLLSPPIYHPTSSASPRRHGADFHPSSSCLRLGSIDVDRAYALYREIYQTSKLSLGDYLAFNRILKISRTSS